MAKVPDGRLDALAEMSESKNVVHARPSSWTSAASQRVVQGEGLGNRFLGGIREVDAIVFVLRAFADDDVPGPDDPLDAPAGRGVELALADLETVENQLRSPEGGQGGPLTGRRGGRARAGERRAAEGVPALPGRARRRDRELLRPYFLLTNKPVLAVVNVGEDELERAADARGAGGGELGGAAEVLGMCVQLEAEAAALDEGERVEMLEGLGLGEGALTRLVRAAYHLLGLRTFLTTGDKESRAWTVRAGAKAPEAAGVIHTDLQRGFIRAEVIRWDELLEIGSWQKAKELGKLRVEGKDYEVVDGDVLEIRFNV